MAGSHGATGVDTNVCDGIDGSALDELFPEEIPCEKVLDQDFHAEDDHEVADSVGVARADAVVSKNKTLATGMLPCSPELLKKRRRMTQSEKAELLRMTQSEKMWCRGRRPPMPWIQWCLADELLCTEMAATAAAS